MSTTVETSDTIGLDPSADPGASDLSPAIPHADNRAVTIIQARRGWRALEMAELWRYRHVLWMFMLRDIKAQQKQTVLGVFWIIISPLVSVAAMTLVFARMLSVPSDGFPYPIFLFAGNFLWGQFSGAFSAATGSVVGNSNFIQRVYFPRLMIPVSASMGTLVNSSIVFPMILIVMLALGYTPQWTVVFCPLLILLVNATGLGMGLWFGPLNATYRDVGRIGAYVTMVGFYLTPVLYPATVFPERYRWLVVLNPMAGYITTFRACLYGSAFDWQLFLVAIAFTVLVLIGGAFFFTRLQGRFADVI